MVFVLGRFAGRGALAAAPVFRGAIAVMARHEHGDDGEEVVGELGGVVLCVIVAVNHEPAPSL